MMRIVHLAYTSMFEYSNPEAWLKRISFFTGIPEGMPGSYSTHAVYNIAWKGMLVRNGVTYHFPAFKRWELFLAIRFNLFIKGLLPDVVIVHGLVTPWQVLFLRWMVGKKLIIIIQHHSGAPFVDFRRHFQRWVDPYVHLYFFSSADLAKPWIEKGQIRNAAKIKEIIGMSSVFSPSDKTVARSKTGVKGDHPFLWVGDLSPNKDPLLVVRTFIGMASAYPDLRLYMIYQSTQLLVAVKALIEESSCGSIIILVGEVSHDNLGDWYNSCDFIISASHYESAGVAVCEGLSCGCIPVLTSIPAFAKMTGNGRIGYLYPPEDEGSLLEAIQKVIAIDRQRAKEDVLQHFGKHLSFGANVKKIVEAIETLPLR